MRVRRFGGLTIGASLLLFESRSAFAEPRGANVMLDVEGPHECVPPGAMRSWLRPLIPGVVFVDKEFEPPHWVLEIRIRREGLRYAGRLIIRDGASSRRPRDVEGTCREVIQAIAMFTSLALVATPDDPTVKKEPPLPPHPPTPLGESTPSGYDEATDSSRGRAIRRAESGPGRATFPKPSRTGFASNPTAAARSEPTAAVRIGAAAETLFGSLPPVSVGGRAQIAIVLAPLYQTEARLSLGFASTRARLGPASRDSVDGVDLRMNLTTLRGAVLANVLSGRWVLGEIETRAGVVAEIGSISGESATLLGEGPRFSHPWRAVGTELVVRATTERFFVEWDMATMIPQTRVVFSKSVPDKDIFRVSPVVMSFGIGAGVSL